MGPWTVQRFSEAANVSEKSVRNWLGKRNLPADLRTVERVLFGNDATSCVEWRTELREAYWQSHSGRGGDANANDEQIRLDAPRSPHSNSSGAQVQTIQSLMLSGAQPGKSNHGDYLDDKRVSRLAEELRSGETKRISRAIYLLEYRSDPFYLSIISRFITGTDPTLAEGAMKALRYFNNESAVEVLCLSIRSTLSPIRYYSAFHLGEIALAPGGRQVVQLIVPELLSALDAETDAQNREEIIHSLGKIGGALATERLLLCVENSEMPATLKARALHAIGQARSYMSLRVNNISPPSTAGQTSPPDYLRCTWSNILKRLAGIIDRWPPILRHKVMSRSIYKYVDEDIRALFSSGFGMDS